MAKRDSMLVNFTIVSVRVAWQIRLAVVACLKVNFRSITRSARDVNRLVEGAVVVDFQYSTRDYNFQRVLGTFVYIRVDVVSCVRASIFCENIEIESFCSWEKALNKRMTMTGIENLKYRRPVSNGR